MNDLAALQDAIRRLHGCESEHVESVPVVERFRGKIAWMGVVELFELRGHPRATRCYAWDHEQGTGGKRYVAVLEVPPVDSARRAVQVAIAAEARGQG